MIMECVSERRTQKSSLISEEMLTRFLGGGFMEAVRIVGHECSTACISEGRKRGLESARVLEWLVCTAA